MVPYGLVVVSQSGLGLPWDSVRLLPINVSQFGIGILNADQCLTVQAAVKMSSQLSGRSLIKCDPSSTALNPLNLEWTQVTGK